MSTSTLGACVGHAHVDGQRKLALVFDTEEPDWFVLVTSSGSRLRRRRNQIEWREAPKRKAGTK